MSLINDALKLAKQNQSASATAVAPALMPTEHRARRQSSGGLKNVLPMVVAVALTSSAFLLWQWSHSGGALMVQAHAATAENSAPISVATALPVLPAPVTAAVPARVPAAVAILAPAAAVIAATPMIPAPRTAPLAAMQIPVAPVTAVAVAAAPTPVVAVVEQPKPPAPSYRLQSIFYRPSNPSAVINGKTVYIGSRLDDAKVTAIGPDSAMLVTAAGQTTKLEMP